MKNMLMEAAARCGMELDERSAAQMAEFWAYLKEVNQSMNLTRVDSDAEAAERHFVDSLAPLKAGLIPRGARVLDVGSGAGFPGMPLAIARPDADVTLMDSLGKRVNFLGEAARRAGVRVSVFSAGGDACGVVERGLAWELEGAVLRSSDHLGVSNEVRDPHPLVGVGEGALLVVIG